MVVKDFPFHAPPKEEVIESLKSLLRSHEARRGVRLPRMKRYRSRIAGSYGDK